MPASAGRLFRKHESKLSGIVPDGEVCILSHALNLSRGGRLVNLEEHKDSNLLKVFDNLSCYTKSFYFGRYDIKCKSIEDLKAGRNFAIHRIQWGRCGTSFMYTVVASVFSACAGTHKALANSL